jgi:hypothetical protein
MKTEKSIYVTNTTLINSVKLDVKNIRDPRKNPKKTKIIKSEKNNK